MAFTPMDDSEAREGTIVSNDFFTQLAANIEYLIKTMPVGTIVPIMTGFNGIPDPNPNIWQICDGSVITNPNSPLVNKNTPALTPDKYLIKTGFGGAVGTIGGNNIVSSFVHNHTGFTDYSVLNPGAQFEDDWILAVKVHRHGIAADLVGGYDVFPRNIKIHHYIKIL